MVFVSKETSSSIGWTPKQSSKKRKLQKSVHDNSPPNNSNEEGNPTLKEEETNRHKCAMVLSPEHLGKQDNPYNISSTATVKQDIKFVDSASEMDLLPPGVSQELSSSSSYGVPSTKLTFQKRNFVQLVAIVGRAQISCIEGKVNILGYSLHPQSIPSSIYVESPNWTSALSIEPIYTSEYETVVLDITSLFPEAVSPSVSSVSSLSSLSYEILHPQRVRSIFITEKWNKIASDIIHDIHLQKKDSTLESTDLPCKHRILVCGAKGVGKSTYVRYITNRLLSTNERNVTEVAILDCDVGQTELSPPGMLTLTVVKRPILSPAHAHMVCGAQNSHFRLVDRHEGACFYGFTTSKTNPESFTAAVSHLMDKYTNLCNERGYKIPLVVNTDGWVKGLGFEILSCIIPTVNCCHVVQLMGSTKAKFFDLTSHASSDRRIHVAETSSGSTLASCNPTPTISRNTSVASLQSLEGEAILFKDQALSENLPHVPSLLTRNLRLCCYFLGGFENFISCGASFQQSGILDDDYCIANTFASMIPYMVPFDTLECHVMDEDGIITRIMSDDTDAVFDNFNSSVVGLCGSSTSDCYGLGIVRGIDRKHKAFYILTPLDETTLGDNVTSIVRGQLQLPLECIFRGEYSETFPFLCCEGVSIGIGNDGTSKKKTRN